MRVLLSLLRKDFVNDYRDPLGLIVQGIFSLAGGVAMGLALRSSAWPGEALLLAGLPLALVFLAVFSLHMTFLREGEAGTLDGLRLAPVPAEVVFLSKVIYSFLIMAAASMLFLGSSVFFMGGLNLSWGLLLKWLAPTLGFLSTVSSMASAMMIYSGARSALSPAMVLVLSAPYFTVSLRPLAVILQGASPLPGWEYTLLALAASFLAIGIGLAKFVVE